MNRNLLLYNNVKRQPYIWLPFYEQLHASFDSQNIYFSQLLLRLFWFGKHLQTDFICRPIYHKYYKQFFLKYNYASLPLNIYQYLSLEPLFTTIFCPRTNATCQRYICFEICKHAKFKLNSSYLITLFK